MLDGQDYTIKQEGNPIILAQATTRADRPTPVMG